MYYFIATCTVCNVSGQLSGQAKGPEAKCSQCGSEVVRQPVEKLTPNYPNLTGVLLGDDARRRLPEYPQPGWTPLPEDTLARVERLEIYFWPSTNTNLASDRWEARAYDVSGELIGMAMDNMGDVGQDHVWDVV